MNTQEFESRKKDHIQHALQASTQALGKSGLDGVHLHHDALPELDFQDVTLDATCLGKPAPTPFYVAGMTAGHKDAIEINHRLALACQTRGWAFGVGSQRRDLEDTSSTQIDKWKNFRANFPSLTVFANLGISQIINAKMDDVQRVLDLFQPQALAIHLNALQEAIQPEGTPQFKGAIPALEKLSKNLKIPIVLKETGCGFSRATLNKISHLQVGAIDVSGLGGTHWGRIEGMRAKENSFQNIAAQTFANWGESTFQSVLIARNVLKPQTEIWASGGVRTGLDSAKLIALGAHRVGYAQPALKAALLGEQELHQWMEQQEFELRVALFCTGSKNPQALRGREGVWSIAAT